MHFPAYLVAIAAMLAPSMAAPTEAAIDSGLENYTGLVTVSADGTIAPVPQVESRDLDKRAFTIRGYLYTTNCSGEHYQWTASGTGCYAYYTNGQLRDMYSITSSGNCKYELFSNANCAFLWDTAQGSNICANDNGHSFKSARVSCS